MEEIRVSKLKVTRVSRELGQLLLAMPDVGAALSGDQRTRLTQLSQKPKLPNSAPTSLELFSDSEAQEMEQLLQCCFTDPACRKQEAKLREMAARKATNVTPRASDRALAALKSVHKDIEELRYFGYVPGTKIGRE
jgi:hypothetical protein